jgi:PleD family two-component response regulator
VQDQMPAYTASVGLAINRADSDEVDAMLVRADAALYLAKANGRNRVEVSPCVPMPK